MVTAGNSGGEKGGALKELTFFNIYLYKFYLQLKKTVIE
jgi:hypothetical protein